MSEYFAGDGRLDKARKVTRAKHEMYNFIVALVGAVIFSIGMNLFVVPVGLYASGILGGCQLIRTWLGTMITLPGFDIAGIINYIFNIPIFILAYKQLNLSFCVKTLIMTSVESFLMTVIPVPSTPLLDETITSCLLGGILCGFGIGLVLAHGYSGGGGDILGLVAIKLKPGMSAGKISFGLNIIVYGICLVALSPQVAIYSLIYAFILSVVVDKLHTQNINVSVLIFTKEPLMANMITKKTGRGVTSWNGEGGYTHKTSYIHMVVMSKHEVANFKKLVYKYDPEAFIIFTEGTSVTGHFETRLEA